MGTAVNHKRHPIPDPHDYADPHSDVRSEENADE